jgi:hypothetical protein
MDVIQTLVISVHATWSNGGTMDNQSEQIFLRLVTAEVTQAIAQALETLIHKKGFEVPIHIAS